jgi:hypothetical protein
MDSNTTGFTLTLPAQLPQPLITYTKVMRYLVSEGAMDNPASIFRGARVHFYGALVDADSIRQDQAVVMGAPCLRDTVIEAQQVCGRTHPCLDYNLPTGPIFDHNLNVVEFVQKDLRQGTKRLCNKLFKQVTFHAAPL